MDLSGKGHDGISLYPFEEGRTSVLVAPMAIIVAAKKSRLAVFKSIATLPPAGVRQFRPIENALSSNGSLFAAERRRGDSQEVAV